jgi:hypothetical protein
MIVIEHVVILLVSLVPHCRHSPSSLTLVSCANAVKVDSGPFQDISPSRGILR